MKENELIQWLLRAVPRSSISLIGNGDDAALLKTGHSDILVATDMLLDGTHFVSETTRPELIGRKAAAVNLSDIAAMGGQPKSLFVSLAVPRSVSLDYVKRIMGGVSDLASEFACGVDGGDTNSWDGKLAINVTIIGHKHWRGALTRSGAQTGDILMVTGPSLGGSLISESHLNFTPRVQESIWLQDNTKINSMIDLSDGLASDARKLAAASSKKIILDRNLIIPGPLEDNSLRSAFCDGEDFELLFTCNPTTATELERKFPWPCGVRRLGTVHEGEGVFVREDLAIKALEFSGYEH